MKTVNTKSLLNLRFPTIIGLVVLVIGLIVGIVVFDQGTGLFLPRASEETTPQNVKITNVTERSFSVSFSTQAATSAFVKIDSFRSGGQIKNINIQASDDRDQLKGTIDNYLLHHVTLTGLDANTEYFFLIGTDKGALYDNNNEKFLVKTAKQATNPPNAKTIYGSVTNPDGTPAKGSIVYALLDAAGEMSQLVQESGSWAIPLSNSRTVDGSSYANITPNTSLKIQIQGHPINILSEINTTVGEFESGSKIVLGSGGAAQNPPVSVSPTNSPTPTVTMATPTVTMATPTASPSASPSVSPTQVPLSDLNPTASPSASQLSSLLGDNYDATPSANTIDLTIDGHQEVSTQQPVIVGTAPAKTTINIVVNSDTHIRTSLVTNDQGEFALDISALEKELEPGEHMVEYSYTDPATGKLITKTRTFTVAPKTDVKLAASNGSSSTSTSTPTRTPTPSPTAVPSYGTDYPYGTTPTVTPSTNPIATNSATASGSAQATESASKGGLATKSASTTSALPKTGAINSTITLIFGGLFFLLAGGWSFWVAKEIERE